jgi:hypothetical protein
MKFVCFLAASLVFGSLSAAPWEHFQGPKGDGISYEKNLKSKSLKTLWKSNIKVGFSSMSIADGMVFSMGNEGGKDYVFALDAKTGKKIWDFSYACPLTDNLYEGGPNATPTYHEGKLYTLSKEGDLYCLDAKSGKELWSKDCRDFGAKKPKWGFAGSPTIVDDMVLVNVGDSGAAFDKASGKVLWSSSGEDAGYASVVPYSKDEAIVLCGNSFKSIDMKSGQVKWTEPFEASYKVNAASPVIVSNMVLISTGYGNGRAAFYDIKSSKPKRLWETTKLKSHFGNPIFLNGYFYAVTGNTGKSCKLVCMSGKSGKTTWEKRVKFGSLRATKDKLYFLNDKGALSVFKANPKEYQEISSTQILSNKCWTPPAISDGVLYARDAQGDIVAVDLKY